MRAMLTRVADIATPGQGAPKIMMAFAKLATADWVEGEVCVELYADKQDPTKTLIAISCDLGGGMRERLLPTTTLNVPVEEFEKELLRNGAVIAPLRGKRIANKIVLQPSDHPATLPPATIDIDEKSLNNSKPPGMPTIPAPQTEQAAKKVDAAAAATQGKDKAPRPTVHNRPTVRQMAALDPETLRRLREGK